MFSSAEEVLRFIAEENVEFVDVRFTDLPGTVQHFTVPVQTFDADVFTEGRMFDGSSIRGFQAIHESDMLLIPDPSTAVLDPFRQHKTLNLTFSVFDPLTGAAYSRDPRNVAAKAEAYLKGTGIADTAFFGPEAEFYIFDSARFATGPNEAYYHLDSIEGAWNTGRDEVGGNLAAKPAVQGRLLPGAADGPLHRPAVGDGQAAHRGRHRDRDAAPRGGHRRPGGDRHPLRQAA